MRKPCLVCCTLLECVAPSKFQTEQARNKVRTQAFDCGALELAFTEEGALCFLGHV